MVKRTFWLKKLEIALKERRIVWLSGVRRAGKTFLAKCLADTEYFDCELPRVRRILEDPETFLDSQKGKRIALDEIHRLGNPSELLKIAADHYPQVQILATGSSTLGATAKFRDTLAGRKRVVWLTPMTASDLVDFSAVDLKHRYLHGGLPPFFLSEKVPERDFQEWMDAYWAKDIQELFRLERRFSFQKFVELIMAQSGGIFEATRFAQLCEVSRGTISNYLKVLETTYVAYVLRPFATRKSSEIVSAPKVYGFDTGFTCYYRGWQTLRADDMGHLWEHYVLNEVQAHFQTRKIQYWRDKRGHEIDFVIPIRGKPLAPIAIECKWRSRDLDNKNVHAFLNRYPQASVFVVSYDMDRGYEKKIGSSVIAFLSLQSLIQILDQFPLSL